MYSENTTIQSLLEQLEAAGCIIATTNFSSSTLCDEFIVSPPNSLVKSTREKLKDLGFDLWVETRAFMAFAFAFTVETQGTYIDPVTQKEMEKKVRISTLHYGVDIDEQDAIPRLLEQVLEDVIKRQNLQELRPGILPEKGKLKSRNPTMTMNQPGA